MKPKEIMKQTTEIYANTNFVLNMNIIYLYCFYDHA